MPSVVVTETHTPTSPSTSHRRASLKVLSRNIDEVVLGNLVFPTWYYSPYPDSIIHEHDHQQPSGNSNASSAAAATGIKLASKNDAATASTTGPNPHANGVMRHTSLSLATTNATTHHTGITNDKAMVDTLHVCPYCFRYTASPADYLGHLKVHVKAESDHYGGRKTRSTLSSLRSRTPAQNTKNSRPLRNKKRSNNNIDQKPKPIIREDEPNSDNDDSDSDSAPKPVPDSAVKVYSHDGYTVWDVDGDVEKLYCQNLSLFGKLFLEQKSVFFDTAGFHYFVLTYCDAEREGRHPPPLQSDVDGLTKTGDIGEAAAAVPAPWSTRSSSSSPNNTRRRRSTATTSTGPHSSPQAQRQHLQTQTQTPPSTSASKTTPTPTLRKPDSPLHHQVLGFFSKENLSWDSNNLACILVFPPYQHRNLGQLLMAVSYKLSGWEWEDSIIGGPEKPLSSMGRKSYLRFWSERVARFVMGQSQDAEGLKSFEEPILRRVRRRGGDENEDDEEIERDEHQIGNGDDGSADDNAEDDDDEEMELVVVGKKRKTRHGKGLLREELSVKELGDRTGMLGEDVVAALVDMGVCELVSPKRRKKTTTMMVTQSHQKNGRNATAPALATAMGAHGVGTSAGLALTSHNTLADKDNRTNHDDDNQLTTMTVHRSRILEWAIKNKVDLVSPIREEGFLGEWAMSEDGEVDDDDDDDDDDDEGEGEEQESGNDASAVSDEE